MRGRSATQGSRATPVRGRAATQGSRAAPQRTRAPAQTIKQQAPKLNQDLYILNAFLQIIYTPLTST